MSRDYAPHPLLPLPTVLACAVLAGIAAGCAGKPVGTRPSSAAGPQSGAGIPVTTASAEARALYLQGLSLTDQLRAHDGRVLFEQAVAKDPAFAMAHYNLAASAPTPKVLSAEVKAAVANSGTVSEGERLLILALQARANADPTMSLHYTEQVAAKYPRDERAHLALGLAYFGEQDYGKAAFEFSQAIAIDSGFSPAFNMLGYANRALGRTSEAEAAFKGYIRLIPGDPNPYDSYAEFLMQAGRFDESIAQYEKALSMDPHFSGSYVGIAADRMYKGEYEASIATAQKLYDAARDHGERRVALLAQAMTDVDVGKTDKALQRLEAQYALDAGIGDTAAMSADAVAMGDVLLDAGRPEPARAKYARALDLITASSLSSDVKADAKLADRYNRSRVALAVHDRSTAAAEAAAYTTGARARNNVLRIRQAHELAGFIALDAHNYDAGATELGQANQQDPYVLYALALAYQGAGNGVKARAFAAAAADANILPTLRSAFVRRKAKQIV